MLSQRAGQLSCFINFSVFLILFVHKIIKSSLLKWGNQIIYFYRYKAKIQNWCNCTPLHFLENVKLLYLHYKYFKKKVNHTEKRKEIRLLAYFLAQPNFFLVVFSGDGKKCLRTRIKCFLVPLFLAKDELKWAKIV